MSLHLFSGVLWLSVYSECTYIGLLAMGFLLMWVEVLCLCAKREMNALKINAFAAMCTVLSGQKMSRGRDVDGMRGRVFVLLFSIHLFPMSQEPLHQSGA